MGKINNQGNKRSTKYMPFYPTTLGSILHDVTFQKLPSYSLRRKPALVNTKCKLFLKIVCKMYYRNWFQIIGSPGPAAYPGDHKLIGKRKHCQVTKTIYPEDKAHSYSMRIKGYNKIKKA